MIECWNKLAIDNGFDGMIYLSQCATSLLLRYKGKELMNYHIEYEPQLARTKIKERKHFFLRQFKRYLNIALSKTTLDSLFSQMPQRNKKLELMNYSDVVECSLNYKFRKDKIIPGVFVDWDNTARMQENGFVINGSSPERFKEYLLDKMDLAKRKYKKDMIFVFAWNEWGECGYLEPDKKNGYLYLEKIREALLEQKASS